MRNKFNGVKFNPSRLHQFSQSVSVSFHLFVSFSISFISVLQFSEYRLFTFFLKKFYFIYVWLCWVFVAARAFSSCGEQGLLWSRCVSFSQQWPLVAEGGLCSARASVAVAPGRKKVKVKVAQLCPALRPRGLYSPWNFPGQYPRVGSCSLLQRIFPTQGSNPHLLRPLRWQADSLPLHHQHLCLKMSH